MVKRNDETKRGVFEASAGIPSDAVMPAVARYLHLTSSRANRYRLAVRSGRFANPTAQTAIEEALGRTQT